MPQTFNDEHASRVVAAIQTRIERKLKSNAMVQTTWGEVATIDSAQKIAGAYLYGETDGAYISGGFRVPETMYLTIGDVVKVAMNYATGERWIEEVNYPPTTHKKIVIDLKTGRIALGDGTVAPTAIDIDSTGIITPDLTVNDDLTLNDDMTLAVGSVLTWAGDTNLFRASANVLRTDDTLEVGADLYVGDDIFLATTSIIDWGASEFELDRAAANILRLTDAKFRVSRVNTTDLALEVMQTGDAAVGWRMDATGKMEWSDGAAAHDTNLYRSAANTLKTDDDFEAPAINMTGTTVNTTFTIGGGGTATFSSKSLTWARLGPWVFVRLGFSVTANGSGTTDVNITGTGLPNSSGNVALWGDRGGVGVVPVYGRGVNSGGEMTITRFLAYPSATALDGAALANGASYTLNGVYLTADAF